MRVPHLICAMLLVGTVATAQGPDGPRREGGRGPGSGPPRPLQIALDTNHDGVLSADEIAAAPQSLLRLDRNGDGSLTPDELQPPSNDATGATPDELTKQLMSFDRNGDGVLTPDELPARLQSLFARADTNHDGKITEQELHALALRQTASASAARNPEAGRDPLMRALDLNHDGTLSPDEIAAASKSLLSLDANHDGQISTAEMSPPQPTPAEQVDHFLAENDTDKDGRVSKAEAPDFIQGQFAQIDKNGDGYLDRDELVAFFASRGAGQRGGPGGGERPVAGSPGDNR